MPRDIQERDLPQELRQKFRVENNTLSRDVKENPKDRIQVEIGDSKQKDFKPQAKIMRWDNDVNFSLRAEEHPDAVVETEGKLIKYKTPDYEVHQYELDPGDIGEDGGLEFEWVLPQKPSTNVLSATIQTKGLNFYYQPALTQEEIDQGAERPENVVGSYAVYHATKGGMNRADGMEYKTGKAFHIYRAKLIDANGNESWADYNTDLNETGILTITANQTWLNNAVYPVVVDPTFGYTSLGGSTSSTNNLIRGCLATSSETSTIDKLTLGLLAASSSTSVDCAIYDGDGNPKVGVTVSHDNLPTNKNWVDFAFSSAPNVNASQTYALLHNGNAAYSYAYDYSGDTNDYKYASQDYGTWKSSYSFSTGDRTHSIYATYTATVSTTVTADLVTTTLSLPAPTVDAESGSTNEEVLPDPITSTISLPAPAISGSASKTADLVTSTISIPAPTISGSASKAADLVTTTLSLQSPTITGQASVISDLTTTTISTLAPTINAVKNVSTTPDPITLTASLPTPSVATAGDVNTSPSPITTTLNLPTFTVSGDASKAADLLTNTLSLLAPTISTTSNAAISTDVVNLTTSIPAPSITGTAAVTADVVNLTTSLPAPTYSVDEGVTTDVVTTTLSLLAPTVTGSASVTADLVNLTASLPSASLSVDSGYSGNSSWGIDINTFGLVMTKSAKIPTWTTASRPTGRKGLFGFNKQRNCIEIYNPLTSTWSEFNPTPTITVSDTEPSNPETGDLWVDTS